ncbi:MAG TPA: DNA-formamidopyrimidine glycosylase family protein [Polyangia bacterium]|nr:DNA-formamidopyrimidine glycosylase family protein [Polyangia bacterium]
MPEGDNIHRHATELQGQLVGRTVKALWARGVAYPRLVGQTIAQVEARGKHLLIDVGPARIHVHLGMQGRLRVGPPGPLAPSMGARASLAIVTDAANAIWWRAPQVEVLRAAFAHAHPVLAALGPDVLSPGFAPADAVARARQRPGDTPLGPLLLDQRVASGIGNVYKSEVLFLERTDPFATVAAVDDATLTRLYARAQQLMRQNLGPWRRTTTRDMSRGGPTPRGEARLHVYRRAGHACRACGTAIRVAYQGDPPRSTYYCPTCQAPQ